MIPWRRHRESLAIIVGAGAGVFSLLMLGGGAASAMGFSVEPETAPQLSVAVSDQKDAVAEGDSLTYAITVKNIGPTDSPTLTITQSVPEGMQFESADSDGTLTGSTVSWTIELTTTEEKTLTTGMSVTATPDELLRLATVVCALPSPDAAPIVCATDSDLLPAGAAAEAAETQDEPAPGWEAPNWWLIGGGAAGVIALAVVVPLAVRRRKAR